MTQPVKKTVQGCLNFARDGPLFVVSSMSPALETEVAVVYAAEAVTSEQGTISESSNPFRKDDAVYLSTMEEEPYQPKLGVYAPVSKSKTEEGKLVTK